MAKARILLIESDKTTSQALQRVLLQGGYEVELVADGLIALNELEDPARRPDVILLRVEIPRRNGYSVCNRIKRRDGLRGIPLVLYSSQATEESFSQHQRLRTRAQGYLMMPLNHDELLGMLGGLMLSAQAAERPSAGQGTSDTNPNLPAAGQRAKLGGGPSDVDRTLVPEGSEEEELDLDDEDGDLLLSAEDITEEKHRRAIREAIEERAGQIYQGPASGFSDDDLDDADRTIIAKVPARPTPAPALARGENAATDAFVVQHSTSSLASGVQTPLPVAGASASIGRAWAGSSPEIAAAASTELRAVSLSSKNSPFSPQTGGLAPFPSLTGAPLPPRPQTNPSIPVRPLTQPPPSALVTSSEPPRPKTSEMQALPPFPSLVPLGAPESKIANKEASAFSVRNAQAELDALIQSREPVHISRPETEAEPKRSRDEEQNWRTEKKQLQSEIERLRSEQQQARDEAERLRNEQQRSREEAERLRSEQQRSREETERLRSEQQRSREETERLRSEQQRSREETERLRSEQQRSREDIERLRSEQKRARDEAEELRRQQKASLEEADALRKANAALQDAQQEGDNDALQEEMRAVRKESVWLRKQIIALHQQDEDAFALYPELLAKALAAQQMDGLQEELERLRHENKALRDPSASTKTPSAKGKAKPTTEQALASEEDDAPTRLSAVATQADGDDSEVPTRILHDAADEDSGESPTRVLFQTHSIDDSTQISSLQDENGRLQRLLQEAQAQHEASQDETNDLYARITDLERERQRLQIEVDAQAEKAAQHARSHSDALSKRGGEVEALEEQLSSLAIEVDDARKQVLFYQGLCNERETMLETQRAELLETQAALEEQIQAACELRGELAGFRTQVHAQSLNDDELLSQLGERERELQSLREEINRLGDDHGYLSSRYREMEAQLDALKQTAREDEHALHSIRIDKERLEKQLHQHADERERLKESHAEERRALLEEHDAAMQVLREELGRLRVDLETARETGYRALSQAETTKHTRIEALESERRALLGKLEKADAAIFEAQEQGHRLKSAQQQLRDEITQLQEDLDASRADARNRLEVEDLLRQQIASLQDQQATLEEELDRAQGKLQNIGDSTEQMEAELVALRHRNVVLEQEKFDVQERTERLESEARSLRELLHAEQHNRLSESEQQERVLDQLHHAEKSLDDWKQRAILLETETFQLKQKTTTQQAELTRLHAEQERLTHQLAAHEEHIETSQITHQSALETERRQAQEVMQHLEREHENAMLRLSAEHQEALRLHQEHSLRQEQALERRFQQQERSFEALLARELDARERQHAEIIAGIRQEHALDVERLLAEQDKDRRQARQTQQEILAEQEISFHSEKRTLREAFQREADALHAAHQQEMEALQIALQEQSHQILAQSEKELRQLRQQIRTQKEESVRDRQAREAEWQAESEKRIEEAERRARLRFEAIIEGLEQRERDLAAQIKKTESALASAREAEQSAALGYNTLQNQVDDLRGKLSDLESLRRHERNQIDLIKREFEQKNRTLEQERDELKSHIEKTSTQSNRLQQQVAQEKAKKDQALDALQHALSMLREREDG
ncbi:response regulator [Myxococcota bacterium]|nr:response regulator [Myxococcota bacterium]